MKSKEEKKTLLTYCKPEVIFSQNYKVWQLTQEFRVDRARVVGAASGGVILWVAQKCPGNLLHCLGCEFCNNTRTDMFLFSSFKGREYVDFLFLKTQMDQHKQSISFNWETTNKTWFLFSEHVYSCDRSSLPPWAVNLGRPPTPSRGDGEGVGGGGVS